jgi:TetR/AcrR family transcriptional repressor of nem operon
MSDMKQAILDAAQARIRAAGYNGFSFRDIAADVGAKSASVHYHFPTKETLAAAVARRYRERFLASVAQDIAAGDEVIEAWTRGFRRALKDDGMMCLCGALGAAASALPEEVATEARRFFEEGLEALTSSGMPSGKAAQVLATLEGAMLLANVLARPSAFDAATADLS